VNIIIEIRFHGRGGQGAVTSAELLAKAAGLDNKYSQAFPAFGPERRGAPVRAFCRISEKPITTRSQVYNPDHVVVLDSSLVDLPEVAEGLKPETKIMINSKNPEKVGGKKTETFNATKLALELLGKNIVNTAMLGAFAKMTGLLTVDSIKKAIEGRFPGKVAEANKQLVEEAFGRFGGKQ
jgi:pyruvate ferredoxin oxidoreductase gamma subunit